MVLSRKKLKRKEAEAVGNPEAVKEEAQVTEQVEDILQQNKKEKKRKRDNNVDVQIAGGSYEGDGGVEIENPSGGENAAKNKKKKEKKKKKKVASDDMAASGDEYRLSNRKVNGAVDHSEAETEATLGTAERGSHEENGLAENGSQVNGVQETADGNHNGMTVRERKGKGKKKKDRWGGVAQDEEENEASVAHVKHEEEFKSQTSLGETDDFSAGERYDPKKICVGGMPYYITEEEIVDYFSECGKVSELDCVLFPDTGKFRGLAFITFQTEEGAAKAIEWDGIEMGGRFLKISWCKIKPSKGNKNSELGDVQKHEGCLSAYIGNLSWDVTEDVIKDFFKQNFSQTNIEAIRFAFDRDTGEFRGFGHIDFADDNSLEAAISLNQSPLLGRPLKIAYSVPRKQPPPYSFGTGTQGRISACHSCGKEGHKAFVCPVKGGAIPGKDGRNRKRR